MISKSTRSLFFATVGALALVACGDSSTELASPGDTGPNPGTTSTSTSGGSTSTSTSGGSTSGGGNQACPAGTVGVTVGTEEHCQLSGTLTDDVTLTAGRFYQLSGTVFVGDATDSSGAGGDPAVLTIEPGVRIYGATEGDILVVSRGSQINAEGAAGDPIVFTSAADLGFDDELGLSPRAAYNGPALEEPFTSEWGGLVINGLATINTCNGAGVCEAEGEGDSGLYGGSDDDDSSGTLKYVQVKYAGNVITSTDELNGIAFQGVGRGTEIDFVHVHNGADDGVEFFGGTVDAKHLIITGADDDSLDWTFGWRGRVQHLLIIQNPNQTASDRGFEGDNNEDGNDFLPRSQPQVVNATIIGAADRDVGDTGIVARRGTGLKVWNAVISNFRDDCLDLDSDATYTNRDTETGVTFESTLLSCDSPFDDGSEDIANDLEGWFRGQANNVVGQASLSGFVNGPAEDAVTATDVSALDGFFDTTSWVGAVRSNSTTDNWTIGWSYGLNNAPICPTHPNVTAVNGGAACLVSGRITQDLRLVGGLEYLIRGQVFVGEDVGGDINNPDPNAASATLTIDAGVTVEAEDAGSTLIVTRGSKIITNGTRNAPVTFTALNSETRNLDLDTSLWGGLVINGRATINTCNGAGFCEAEGEGDSGLYGGNFDADNSGRLLYTRVVYAGNVLTSTDELNGIAFQGVGNGTEIDFLQVHNGADDGVEFFGGTVNAKHLVITGADDDSIDWTFGWRGKVQYALVVQNPNQTATDRGIEADNNEDGNDFLPRSQPMFANLTLVGVEDQGVGDTAMVLRRGTGFRGYNILAENWRDDCLDLDSDATYANRDTTTGITFESSLMACTNNFDDGSEDVANDLAGWFLGQPNNVAETPANGPFTVARTSGGKAYITNQSVVTATDVSAADSFFEATDFIGAVKDEAGDWVDGWTVWLDQ